MPAAPILLLDQTDSTNAEARRRADAGETGPLWIVARRQTAGRGRRGRQWESQDGNLFSTLMQVTRKSPAEAAQVTFVAALAIADLLDDWAPASLVTIKWPNDVMLAGQKASGVLVESGAHESGGLWLAVGIGVNLAEAPPRDQVERPTAALADIAGVAPPAPADFLAGVAGRFESWREIWMRDGFPPVGEAWTRMAEGLGGPCTARLPDRTLTGTAEALEADGALRLRLDGGEVVRVTAGDVFFGET